MINLPTSPPPLPDDPLSNKWYKGKSLEWRIREDGPNPTKWYLWVDGKETCNVTIYPWDDELWESTIWPGILEHRKERE